MSGGPLMILGSCHVSGLLAFAPRLVQAPILSAAKGLGLPTLLFFLIAAHAVCDYPWQGDYLAKSKNRHLKGDSAGWVLHIFYHSMIHGAAVLFLTGSLLLACAEVLIHSITDAAKCENWINGKTDQAVHLVCKVAWALIAWSCL